MHVRLGCMVNPSVFWAAEIPALGKKNSPWEKVLRLENELGCKFYSATSGESGEMIRLKGKGMISNPMEGQLVVVRRHWKDSQWYRGKILTLISTGGILKAHVFLVDYGIYLTSLPVVSCLREFPEPEMGVDPPHLAFLVFLSGIRPVSYDIDYEIGMKTLAKVIAKDWSPTSITFIKHIINQSPNKLAEIINIRKDKKLRIHGEIILHGFTEQVNLNDMLIKYEFGIFSEDKLKEDLRNTVPDYKPGQSLSICGRSNISNTTSIKDNSTFGFPDTDDEDEEQEEANMTFNTTVSSRCGVWSTVAPRIKKPKIRKITKLTNVELLAAIKKRKYPENYSKPEEKKDVDKNNIWTAYRNDGTSENRSKDDNSRKLFLPAGVDTGLYLEEQLRQIPENPGGIGPKLI